MHITHRQFAALSTLVFTTCRCARLNAFLAAMKSMLPVVGRCLRHALKGVLFPEIRRSPNLLILPLQIPSSEHSVVPVSLAGTYRHYWEPPLYAVCIKDGSTCVLTTDVTCLKDINAEGVLKLQAGFRPYYARNIYALSLIHI